MKVTVITVCFDSAATIAETLASVAAQSHTDIEHIVIDGASKDTTLQRVREHGAHVARVLSEPDCGIYDAMNKGLALARGELVGFLNADDVFAGPQCVARLAAAAATEGTDAVFGDLVYVRAENTQSIVRRWSSGPYGVSRLRYGWMPPHPTFYVRRALLDQVGGFDTTLRIAADYDFMLRCLLRPGMRAGYVPQPIVRMRMGGISNRSLASMRAKSYEDLVVMRRHGVGGVFTLLSKNLRKLPQFITRSALAG
jgi:glycosyltransferase